MSDSKRIKEKAHFDVSGLAGAVQKGSRLGKYTNLKLEIFGNKS